MSLLVLGAVFISLWLLKQITAAVLSQQIRGSIPDYTARKARAAARRLPEHLAESYETDWLAELAALEAKPISALRFAHGLARASRTISASAGPEAERAWWPLLSRALDVLGALAFLLLLLPLLVSISLLAKLSRPSQRLLLADRRYSKHGRPFLLHRFRAGEPSVGDSRLGRFLGRTDLDYLPRFINVVRGDISFIGPPPHRIDPLPAGRPPLRVRPGMASWQLLSECGALDLDLSDAQARDAERSLRNDLSLLRAQVIITLRGYDLRPRLDAEGAAPHD